MSACLPSLPQLRFPLTHFFPDTTIHSSAMAGQEAATQQGQGKARKGTRAPNWNNQELALLFSEAAKQPQLALGLAGGDLRTKNRRHAFFARLATSISALGVCRRDGNATQRRLMESVKGPRDSAASLIRQEMPIDEAVQTALRGAGPLADLLTPLIHIYLQNTSFGTDTLAGAAAALHPERGRPPAPAERPPPAQPPPRQSSCTMPATAGPSHAEPHDAVMSEAVDDLSLASTSSERQMAHQVAPAAQDVVEREQLPERQEDISSSDSDNPAQGDVPLLPAPEPIDDPEPFDDPEPIAAEARPAERHPVVAAAAAAAEVEAAGDILALPLVQRARGPRAAHPLPRDLGALWRNVQQGLSSTGVQFRDAMRRIETTLHADFTASQTAHRESTEGLQTTVRESMQTVTEALQGLQASMGAINQTLLQMHASRTEQHAARRGRGRGRGQRQRQGGSVSPPISGHARVQEESSGESQSGAEAGGRAGRSQARRPARRPRSWSSPPHPPPPSKRTRRQ